jgi:hypothetical protein
MKTLRFPRALAALLVIAAPALAGAATLVSNMGNATNGTLSPQSTFWIAQQFTTDSSGWTLSSVQFHGARNASQSLAVSVWSDNGSGLPLASIGTFDASGVTTTIGAQTLPAVGTIALAANTSYWIVIAPSDVNTAFWSRTSDLTSSGTGTIPNAKASSGNSGSSWSALVDASNNLMIAVDGTAADTTPDAFSFVDQTSVPLSTTITSAPITVSGINAGAPISVVGGQYSINGGGFTSSAGTVADGDSVRARHTSSASFSTSVDTTVTIGGVADTFTSTTVAEDATPDAFSFVDQTGVPLSTTITSAPIVVSGINSTAAISVSGGLYSVNGGAFTSVPGSVAAGDSVRAQHTSAASFSTSVDTTVTIGGVADTFTSTTVPETAPGTPVPTLSWAGLLALAVLLGVAAVRRI